MYLERSELRDVSECPSEGTASAPRVKVSPAAAKVDDF